MTEIIDIDPVDFAGAVGHVAAGQLYEFLTEGANAQGEADAVNWYGGGTSNTNDIQADVTEFARYVGRTSASGETLWRWGTIEGLVLEGIPENGHYAELPLAQRMAFEMFSTVCAIAHRQIDTVQIEIRKAAVAAAASDQVEGLKLEDSIFEKHGSLGDMEPHQKQFLEDQAAAARKAAAEPKTKAKVGKQLPAEKPQGLSIGQQEEQGHAQGNSGEGQSTGGAAAPDPAAQGSVPGVSGDGSAGKNSDGLNDLVPYGDRPGASELGATMEQQTGATSDQGAVNPPPLSKRAAKRAAAKSRK